MNTHEATWQDGEDLCRHKMTLTLFNQFMTDLQTELRGMAILETGHVRHIDSRAPFIARLEAFCQAKQQEGGQYHP